MNSDRIEGQWKQQMGKAMHHLGIPPGFVAMSFGNVTIIRLLAIAFFFSVLQPENAKAQCPPVPVVHTGIATFYTFADGTGACGFDATPNDLMIGAMNAVDYNLGNSQVCGGCVSLTGPNGTILIRIVDKCPECPQGNIDLSPLAFSMIRDTIHGIASISWRIAPCVVTGPIQYHFKDGSNEWWTAIQIRNHRYPILSLEFLNSQGIYQSVNRVNYNYFVQTTPGMGPGPYTFRVTDIYGHVLVDAGVPHMENSNVSGHGQFPSCDDPLPIQLASFTATVFNQQMVRLEWTTLTEINNYGFEIQKSDTLQQHYQTIPNSFIPGHGTTNVPQRYSWISTVTSGVWYYRLKQTDLDGSVHYSEGIRADMLTGVNEKQIPTVFSLGQNFPNPFNPTTTIEYGLPKQSAVRLEVYNTLGQRVALLVDEVRQAGSYSEKFSGGNLASGVYFYRLQAGDFVRTKKLVLLR